MRKFINGISCLSILLPTLAFADGSFQAGAFTCSLNGKVVSTWTISAPDSDGLPLVEYTSADTSDPYSARGLGVVAKTPSGTRVGIPTLRSGGAAAIYFSDDGKVISVGASDCVKTN